MSTIVTINDFNHDVTLTKTTAISSSAQGIMAFLPPGSFDPWLIHPLCLADSFPGFFSPWLVCLMADSLPQCPHLGRFTPT